jgi:anthranilate 1,2-dioxygenase small subunit
VSLDLATRPAAQGNTFVNLDITTRLIVEDLIVRSAMLIDRDDLETWIASFEPEGRYIVLPRENRDLGYEIALIKCEKRAILEDRVMVLRSASKFNPHVDRHILSRSDFVAFEGGIVTVQTNYTIVQSTLEGVSKLFCAGTYEDRIRVRDGVATFVERVAVLDTFSVPNLIATPI